ncbi:MAG: PAS and ANTAR domain-containing protein [Mycobacterium sp.]
MVQSDATQFIPSRTKQGLPADVVKGLDAVDLVISPGEPQRVGSFRFFIDGQRWEWSDAVAQMHGYAPGTVTPTTDLLLEHKHPEDRQRVAVVLGDVLHGKQFSSRHRIVDTAGKTHWMIVVGDKMLDDAGTVIGTSGFYIDITDTLQSDVNKAVSRLATSRAVIEQAKGVLMAAYGITDDRAFDVLVWRSQETNTKLRELAERFLTNVTGRMSSGTVADIDHALLTLE